MRNGNRAHIFVVLSFLLSGSAFAQATRTWVSGVGDDANPCSRTAPCKTFAGAISKTAAGGEISVLDPGGFGTVTVSKSMTIDGHGNLSSILAAGVPGVIINAGANDVVTLRGLSITSGGTGTIGVRVLAAKAVHVEDCTIQGFTQSGIELAVPSATASASLYVRNSTVQTSGGSALKAVEGRVIVDRTQLLSSNAGIDALTGAQVVVNDTVIAGHTAYGVRTQDTAVVTLERGVVASNGVGIQADGQVRISNVLISLNNTGIAGNVVSFGNNRLAAGNATPGTPSSQLQQQ